MLIIGTFVLLVVLASTLQRVSGFSFALLVVAGASTLKLAGLWEITFAVTLMTMASTASGLISIRRLPAPRALIPILAGVLPGTVCGLVLLSGLSAAPAGLEDLSLGVFTIAAGAMLWGGQVAAKRWSRLQMALIGGLSGLSGGAFGAPGPPLVYALYRQPIALEEIRSLLFSVFLLFGGLRTILAFASGVPGKEMSGLLIAGLPATLVGTYIGRRLAPRLSGLHVRGLSIGLLILSGLIMIIRSIL